MQGSAGAGFESLHRAGHRHHGSRRDWYKRTEEQRTPPIEPESPLRASKGRVEIKHLSGVTDAEGNWEGARRPKMERTDRGGASSPQRGLRGTERACHGALSVGHLE